MPLTEKDLIIGGKYIPISKSTWGSFERSGEISRMKELGQPFLYFLGRSGGDLIFSVQRQDRTCGDFFLPEDVIPYEEEPDYSIF